jgi:hypothetical protein
LVGDCSVKTRITLLISDKLKNTACLATQHHAWDETMQRKGFSRKCA